MIITKQGVRTNSTLLIICLEKIKLLSKPVFKNFISNKVQNAVWIAIFMQLFLAALDKIIFRDYTYNSVIYHCYIGGVQNKRKWNDFRKYPPGSESRIFRKRI